jgi:hypothetical protein
VEDFVTAAHTLGVAMLVGVGLMISLTTTAIELIALR